MNYRHSYHAGNVCDVIKHNLLIGVLSKFQEKNKPFGVLDTHAGTGLYYLEGQEAAKTCEHEQGIKQIWKAHPKHLILKKYLKIIHSFNSDGILKYYPGSPLIIERFLKETDRLICAELHPQDGKDLKSTLKHQTKISVHVQDGYLAPKAFLPFSQKRGLILIDPPFEEKDEFSRMIAALQEGVSKFPQGVFMLWYPLKSVAAVQAFYQKLSELKLLRTVKTEFFFYKKWEDGRLNGSGMVFVNLPWGLEEDIKSVFVELNSILAFESFAPWVVEAL